MFPERSPENNVFRVAPFLFFQYIARMLWRVRNARGRPLNAPAAFIHPCQPIVAKQPPSGQACGELSHEARLPSFGGLSYAVRNS
jgi:hypothetical protein